MERQMYHYATVSKALEELAAKGFTTDFNIEDQRIRENPNDFEIEHIYYYEGESDPGDEATVYGIRSSSGELGVFVAGQFQSGSEETSKVLHNLSIKGRE